MLLSDMDSRNFDPDVVMIQTPSSRLEIFISDKVKRLYACNAESTLDINTQSDLKRVKELVGILPPNSEKWLIKVNLDKLNNKDLVNVIKNANTCVFVCTCSKYKTFKTFKESFDDKDKVNLCSLYINYLKRADFVYLYDAFVPSDKKLASNLFNFVIQGYSGDIDAVFDLFLKLAEGEKITSQRDITNICGLGSTSIEAYIFSFLKPLSGSDKGFLQVISNRMKVGNEMLETLGVGTLYNYMAKSLFLFCELKMLMLSGVVYKTVRNLPTSYDEKALAKYQKYIWRIKEIPMSELLLLRQCMGEVMWKTQADFVTFIYKYYMAKFNRRN